VNIHADILDVSHRVLLRCKDSFAQRNRTTYRGALS